MRSSFVAECASARRTTACAAALGLGLTALVAAGTPAASAATPGEAATTYTIAVLPVLPNTVRSAAVGVDANGRIAGTVETAGGPRAVTWRNGKIKNLGSLGGSSVVANGVSTAGVVGTATTASRDEHAFLYTDSLRDLGTLGGRRSRAYAINDRGQVVGESQIPSGLWHPFLWEKGVMTDLTTRGIPASAGLTDISNTGFVSGVRRERNGIVRGFVWKAGLLTRLAFDEGRDCAPLAVNDSGVAVGWGVPSVGNGVMEAFVWRDGVATQLPGRGTAGSTVEDINTNGVKVGGVGPIGAVPAHSVAWTPGALPTTLPNAFQGAERPATAVAVNDKGVVVGHAMDDSETDHAVVWTPVG